MNVRVKTAPKCLLGERARPPYLICYTFIHTKGFAIHTSILFVGIAIHRDSCLGKHPTPVAQFMFACCFNTISAINSFIARRALTMKRSHYRICNETLNYSILISFQVEIMLSIYKHNSIKISNSIFLQASAFSIVPS